MNQYTELDFLLTKGILLAKEIDENLEQRGDTPWVQRHILTIMLEVVQMGAYYLENVENGNVLLPKKHIDS